MKKMNVTALGLVIILCLSILPLSAAAGEVGLDGIKISLDPDNIDAGENFDVEITLEEPDDDDSNVDVDVEIFLEDLLVHEDSVSVELVDGEDYTFTINSRNFEVDGERMWRDNLMSYACGDYDIGVTVGDEVSD
ncbi:hypothetical protein ACFLRC_05215, partial [Candidatus Altiarchaeota archaeon]